MAKRSNFNKLAQMRESERARALQGNPSLLSGLTPTQIAELFPDYFKRGTPDVGGFYAAISKESAKRQQTWQGSVDSRLDQQGGMLSRMRKEYAGEGGEGKIRNMVKAQEVYNYLRAKGVDHIHAVGMLNNIEHESGFNAASKHYDVNGPSAGLFQHHDVDGKGGRFSQLKTFTNGDWSDWRKQVDFALQEGVTKKYLAQKFNSAEDASVYFTYNFENPANKEQVAADRLKTIKTFDKFTQTGETTPQGAQGDQRKGQTPQQQAGSTTPGAPAGDTTAQAGKVVEGTKFNVVSGYIVPQDKSLYDSRNAQQCATLGKAFNPNIGRSSGWTIVDGDIKAGQVVATKQYNNGGADRVGAGYHTGVALTAPNEKGDFLLLEQYNGSGGAKTRWVNKNSYPIGHTGQTTSWGLISSGGKVHDEISQEALAYGEKLGGPNKESVGTNAGTPGQGGETAPGVEGQVEYAGDPGQVGGTTVGEGEQQSASLMQPVAMMQSLMGMMGGMGGATAIPLGLITTAMGFIMPLIGSIAGERLSGEGMGDGGRRGRKRGGGSPGIKASVEYASPEIKQEIISAKSEAKQTSSELGRQHLLKAMNDANITDKNLRNIMAANAKGETGYTVKSEDSYSGTGNARIRDKFSKTRKLSNSQIDALKRNDEDFFNFVYGGKLGNNDPGDGYKYRGRGQIQITGKENYKFYGERAGFGNKLVENPELLNDPAIAAKVSVAFLQHKNETYPGKTAFERITKGVNTNKETVSTKAQHFATIAKTGEAAPEATVDIAGATQRFEAAKQRYAQAQEMNKTMLAGAQPSQTTPGVGAAPTTVAQTQPRSIMERVFPSSAAEKAPTAAQPRNLVDAPLPPRRPVTTPGSMNLSAQPAPPGAGITPEAMRSVGISAKPGTSEGTYRERVLNQFGVGNIPTPTATVAPQNNRPSVSPGATPASTPKSAPTVVTPSAQLQAPGPAPDTTAMQMRTQMQTVAMAQSGEAQRPMPQMQQVSQVSNVLNHDQTMKMIQNPADNPSVYRAFARTATGEELPGALGHGHFSNGNSVA